MLNLRSALRKDLEGMVVAEVGRAVESVKADFTATTDFIISEQNDLKSNISEKENRIKQLELELSKSQNSLTKLQSRLSTIEKVSRDLNLEIHELPENKSENLMALFKKLCECLQVGISESDVKACRRIAKMNSSSKRPRNVLVTLSSQRLRDVLLSAVTRYNKGRPDSKLCATDLGISGSSGRIYLSEHLSPESKELHNAAQSHVAFTMINIFYQNVNRIRSKLAQFTLNLLNSNFDVICLTETNLNMSVFDGEVVDARYNLFRRDRADSSSAKVEGGGVLLAVHKKYQVIRQASWDSDMEDVWVTLIPESCDASRLNLCVCYLPLILA
ncbi:hypothetical protein HF086_002525 [Spodoptera exigua]|uniref:Uncharacterized protein n=1 Tax=Spodoptera exigua TaxID=7107 RepID=A0A922M4C0_SPOEX|nr:hypothetical protein HF086_002525 [Spodoptera exigua]